MELVAKKVTELLPFERFKIGKQRNFRTLGKLLFPDPEKWSKESFEHMKDHVLLICINCSQYRVSKDTIVLVEKKHNCKSENDLLNNALNRTDDDLPF